MDTFDFTVKGNGHIAQFIKLHWLLREQGVTKPDPKRQISDVARHHYPSVDYPEAEKVLYY